MGAPFPTGLTAAARAERLAWTLNERGVRNVYVAEGPAFTARRLTPYAADDGQELSAVTLAPDGAHVLYVRGGDFGSNWDDALPVNPTGLPIPPRTELWTIPFGGGTPVSLGEGLNPVVSPDGRTVVFERGRQLWRAPVDGSAPAVKLTELRGSNGGAVFSPDGRRLAFVSSRGDHAFIGIYTDATTPIQWIAPGTARDWSPVWSPDGTQLVFARRPGAGGPPPLTLEIQPAPWSLWVAEVAAGTATERWRSDATLRGSIPSTDGGINLHWPVAGRITFLSYHDGWPHLYALAASGTSVPQLLSPGAHQAEHVTVAAGGTHLLYAGNAGSTAGDHDRRHVVRVAVDRQALEVLTPGTGLEWSPVSLPSGAIAAIVATAQQPPVPAVLVPGGAPRLLTADRVPSDFPAAQLVTPRAVTFRAADGVLVHAQLFEPAGAAQGKRPAIVYVHGGPPRQMLLGWHYGDYYWNAYAMNQYLASRGFVVLSVNYRLGIGYGHDFHRPPNAGMAGASEYRDIVAAGRYLRARAGVDPARIGIYGGSYGGYLTALALGRNSDLFATGVDIHGVHDFTSDGGSRFGAGGWSFERDAAVVRRLAQLAWSSSPVSAVATWRAPVLLIHGDDDRNVRVSQTVDLVQRLRRRGVPMEELLIPDDTHHWMRHANLARVNAAIADYLERQLKPGR
jgi:dipeptidyl aminopeptidase/acylaminoacyl peptidase